MTNNNSDTTATPLTPAEITSQQRMAHRKVKLPVGNGFYRSICPVCGTEEDGNSGGICLLDALDAERRAREAAEQRSQQDREITADLATYAQGLEAGAEEGANALDAIATALALLANVTGSSGAQQVLLNRAMALLRDTGAS